MLMRAPTWTFSYYYPFLLGVSFVYLSLYPGTTEVVLKRGPGHRPFGSKHRCFQVPHTVQRTCQMSGVISDRALILPDR